MTIKQKRRAKIIGKNSTTQAELLEAGYSPSTARHQPPSVTKAKGWMKLLDEKLPDDELLTATQEALKAEKLVALPDEPNVVVPDHAIRLKAAEQGYKLKGRFGDGNTTNVQINNYEKAAKAADRFVVEVQDGD